MSYIAVTEPQSNPFAPLTSELVKQLRDNPIAIAQGLAGAPRIEADATQGSVAGGTLLFSATGGDSAFFLAGPDQEVIVPGSFFRATTTCSVRVSGEVRITGGSNFGATLTAYKNNVSIQSVTSTGTTFVAMTPTDVSLVVGDVIHFRVSTGSSTGQNAICRRVNYSTGSQRSVGGI